MFLSIIIPVYNARDYLRECLESVLDQDIDDYEVILVNDGSNDGSLEILCEYQQKHENVVLVDQENAGVSSARNKGLTYAQGDYIWFVDSDDLLQRNCLRGLEEFLEEQNYDRVSVGAYVFQEELSKEDIDKYYKHAHKKNANFYDSSVNFSILKHSYLKEHELIFKYQDLAYSEDSIFMFEFSLGNPSVGKKEDILYYYRHRPGSAMTSRTQKSQMKRVKSFQLAAEIMNGYYTAGQGDARAAANLLMSSIWHCLYTLTQMPRQYAKSVLKQLHKEGLFPFRRVPECTLIRSYETSRTDMIGKIFDFTFTHLHTRSGYYGMRFIQRMINARHKDR